MEHSLHFSKQIHTSIEQDLRIRKVNTTNREEARVRHLSILFSYGGEWSKVMRGVKTVILLTKGCVDREIYRRISQRYKEISYSLAV
jgi:hypothetical protein